MGRLRDFGLDVASYFGLGEGSAHARDSDEDGESWLGHVVGLVVVLVLAFVLHRVLGLEDDFVGFLVRLGLAAVLAMVWGLVVQAAHRGHR